MEGQRAKNTRTSTRRSKRGCITCRIRRVKCDETKPFCARCTKTGRKCDGYLIDASSTLSKALTTTTGSENEHRSIAYMRANALPELQAYFENDFWERLVFQRSARQPAVHHAIVSFSAIHEALRLAAGGATDLSVIRTNRKHALSQYSKSLKVLSEELARPSRDTMELALVCCILFICFENVVGNQAGAIKHIENGIRIANEWSDRSLDLASNTTNSDFKQHLLPVLAHLDNQATIFLNFRIPQLRVKETYLPQQPPPVSAKLQTFREGKTALHAISKQIISFLTLNYAHKESPPDLIPAETLTQFRKLEDDWRMLGMRFDAFIRSNSTSMSARDVRGSYIAKMMHHSVTIMLSNGLQKVPQSTSTGPGSHQARYEAVVSLARSLLESLKRSATGTSTKFNGVPLFSLEYSIVPPLYMVAYECKEIETRRQAVALLDQYPAREGLWEAKTAAVIARRGLFMREEMEMPKGAMPELARQFGVLSPEEDAIWKETWEENLERWMGVEQDHGIGSENETGSQSAGGGWVGNVVCDESSQHVMVGE